MKKENKRNSKKTKIALIGLSILAVVGISGISAYFTDTTEVTNKAKMGIVDIDLKEYTLDDEGKKVEWKDLENVLPGQEINKIPEIECVDGAADCYIRAKVTINNNKEDSTTEDIKLTLENLNIDTSKWLYCAQDGYFYYKNILSDDDEPVVLFTKVNIPSAMANEWSLKEFSIDITADAIQSENFTPDFSESTTNPWPGITAEDIEECIYPDHVK